MEELKMFYLPFCMYCNQAKKDLEALYQEHPEYKEINLVMINEGQESELADQYDYYYVPSFYLGDKKLHEGAITKDELRQVLDQALSVR